MKVNFMDKKLNFYRGNYTDYKKKDTIVLETKTETKKMKPPKISKGGKWS